MNEIFGKIIKKKFNIIKVKRFICLFFSQVLDKVEPVGLRNESKDDTIWDKIGEDPIITKKWMDLISYIDEDGRYRVHLCGIFERINPLKYKGRYETNTFLYGVKRFF